MAPRARRRFGERLGEFHDAQEEDSAEFKSLLGSFLPFTLPAIVAILVVVGAGIITMATGLGPSAVGAVVLIAVAALAILWRRRRAD